MKLKNGLNNVKRNNMIDNIDVVKSLLNFSEPGDFYMLYVFKRKKDQPEGERDNHQSVRTIKTYCVDSLEYLDKRYDEIKQLCEMFKARAYIHVQKQNHRDVSLEMLSTLAQRIKNGTQVQKGLFDSVVGQIKTQEKRWIVDIDTKNKQFLRDITMDLMEIQPVGNKVEKVIPTKNGFHLITQKFNVMEFSKLYPEVEIQKKNPTLLYYPNVLDDGK
jgi:hypothetical protein